MVIYILFEIQAIEYFQKLLHDLDIICSYPLDPLFEGVLNFVTEFHKFKPDLVARAHLQVSSTSLIVQVLYVLLFLLFDDVNTFSTICLCLYFSQTPN